MCLDRMVFSNKLWNATFREASKKEHIYLIKQNLNLENQYLIIWPVW